MLREEIKEIILEMSKEFDDKDAMVTCEISIHKDVIDEMNAFVNENTDIKLGNWVAMECDTCVDHNGDGYVHVSIERFSTIEKIEVSSNFIKTFKK